MICSASDFSSSGFKGWVSSPTRSPLTRIVAGRPTLSSRSEPLRWTICVIACLKLNAAPEEASAMGVHSEKGLAELDRLGVLHAHLADHALHLGLDLVHDLHRFDDAHHLAGRHTGADLQDRKSTRLNSSHRCISYAVFCLKKKKKKKNKNRHKQKKKKKKYKKKKKKIVKVNTNANT